MAAPHEKTTERRRKAIRVGWRALKALFKSALTKADNDRLDAVERTIVLLDLEQSETKTRLADSQRELRRLRAALRKGEPRASKRKP